MAKKKTSKAKKKTSSVKIRHTVEMKGGSGVVQLVGNKGFKLQLKKLRASELLDQSDEVLSAKGQGCITNPGGPGC